MSPWWSLCGAMMKPWGALRNPGEPWGVLGNPEEPWATLGNPGEPWGTLVIQPMLFKTCGGNPGASWGNPGGWFAFASP